MDGKKRRKRLKWILWSVLLVIVVLLGLFVRHLVTPRNFPGTGEKLPLPAITPDFYTLYYGGADKPRGIVILGTGDGGWSYWEENTATHLAAKGFAVGGWDCRKFADTRQYGLAELAAGFSAAVEEVRKRSQADESTPIWYGGWSTGAEQSLAAASVADRPAQLKGLLMAAPGTHGRYGITEQDLLGVDPSGPGAFALADIAKDIKGIRVVQFAAGLDPMDDTDWIKSLSVPYKVVDLPGKLHDMGQAGDDFQKKLDEAIEWTLSP